MPRNERFKRKLLKAMKKNDFLSDRGEWRVTMEQEVMEILKKPASLVDRNKEQVSKVLKWMNRFAFSKSLSKENKVIFAKHMTREEWFDGETVLDSGSLDRFMHVLDGCVETVAQFQGDVDVVKSKIWPSHIYGLESVFSRITSVCENTMRAVGDTVLLTMTRTSYERELQEIKKKKTWTQMQVFHGIQEGGIMGLARLSKQMTFGINETILREGEEIRHVFIIGSGQVKVGKLIHETNGNSTNAPLAILGKGEIFGAYELLKAERSAWKVIAHTSNVELLAIKAKHLRTLPDETKYWLSDILKMVHDFNRSLMRTQVKFHTGKEWNEPAPLRSELWNSSGADVSGAGGLLMGRRMRKAQNKDKRPKKKKERRKRTAQEKAAKKEEQKLLMAKYGDVIGRGLNVAKYKTEDGSEEEEGSSESDD